MRHDVELQIRTAELRLQLRDTPEDLARVQDVVLTPVVRKDIERILVTIRARIVPIAVAVTGVLTQRYQQISVDVNFRQQTRELHRLDDFPWHEIVMIRREVGTDRQSFLRRAKCGRPNYFARLRVDQLSSEGSRNDDHRALSGSG